MSIRDLFHALGLPTGKAAPHPSPEPRGVQRLPVPAMEPWNCYFTLDDEHQVVVTVEHDSLVLGTYEQTIEVQVCGSDRVQCLESYLRYLRNCE